MIGIGIDTGGTYTDAVIYDLEKQQTLSTSKALTTHQQLEIGISNALDLLSSDLLVKAQFLSLSTTLATNACVEGTGGRAKLIFINVEQKSVLELYENYGLPHPDEIYFLNSEEPYWEAKFIRDIPSFEGYDSIAVVQIFAKQDNAQLEKQVRSLLKERLEIPCICGHDLFQDLNVLRRGSSTLLNARLIPVIQNFIKAIKTALIQRNLSLPIVIVRSDGSLMSLNFTLSHPVETLLCGPAASIIAGARLTNQPDALVIDMGGTTTDIAIIEDGNPVTVKSGISIGEWKTFVKGLYVDTFGLGGDSAIHYEDEIPFIDTRRAIPLCILAQRYPYVIEELEKLVKLQITPHHIYLHEFLVLMQDIEDHPAYTEAEKELCRHLKDGPMIYSKAAAAMGKDIYGLHTERLEDNGIIIRAGLTPTDIMHIKGDFTSYNTEAALQGALFVSLCTNKTVDQLCDCVYDMVEKKLYCNLVRIILKHQHPHYEKFEQQKLLEHFIEDSYQSARCKEPQFCGIHFTTKAALIGIGAPIHIFLDNVAKLLGTKSVLLENAPVANALGAVIGNVNATCRVEIKPVYTTAGISEYLVYGTDDILHFEEYEPAKEAAIQEALNGARQAAINQGAADVTLSYSSDKTNPTILKSDLFLLEAVIGRAIGNISMQHS